MAKKPTTKQERIVAEETRLRQVFGDLPMEQARIVEGLICEAAYMRVTLQEYRADLDEKGYVESFTQSEKTAPYERERPVARLYNTMNKNYQSIVKILTDMLPDIKPNDVNALTTFLTTEPRLP